MPTNKLVKVGVWEHGRFIGVVIFGPGATPTLCMTYKISQQECCELVRIALTDHEAPVSRILSIAIKFLKRSNPGLKLIVSFADQNAGHHGGVYQATNWVYVGEGGPSKIPFLNGKRVHERSLSLLVKSGKARREDCEWRPTLPKYKYLMPLDDEMRRQIEPLRKQYPKRAPEAEASMRPSSTRKKGGSSPTSALHSQNRKERAVNGQ